MKKNLTNRIIPVEQSRVRGNKNIFKVGLNKLELPLKPPFSLFGCCLGVYEHRGYVVWMCRVLMVGFTCNMNIEKSVMYILKKNMDTAQCQTIKGSLTLAMGKCQWFSVKIKVCQSSLSSP